MFCLPCRVAGKLASSSGAHRHHSIRPAPNAHQRHHCFPAPSLFLRFPQNEKSATVGIGILRFPQNKLVATTLWRSNSPTASRNVCALSDARGVLIAAYNNNNNNMYTYLGMCLCITSLHIVNNTMSIKSDRTLSMFEAPNLIV